MKIDLSEKVSIRPEFSSYNGSTSFNIRIGSYTKRTNFITNVINVVWKLKNNIGSILNSGNIDAKFNNFNTTIQINNLDLNSIYTFEVLNPDFTKNTAVIFTGNILNFQVVDEDFIFQDNGINIYGDLIFNDDRKIRFPYNWTLDRKMGNGIIIYKNMYYLYCPKYIFTSKIISSESISFSPFSGYRDMEIKIITIPVIEKIYSHKYLITPPTRVKITFRYEKVVLDPVTKVLQKTIFKNQETRITNTNVREINLLDFSDDDYTSIEFGMIY